MNIVELEKESQFLKGLLLPNISPEGAVKFYV